MNISQLELQIFDVKESNFQETALLVFKYQAKNVEIYKRYIELMSIDVDAINTIEKVPFLPISFFKTNQIVSQKFNINSETIVFESSGTTGQISSKHYVVRPSIYEKSFQKSFKLFFGNIDEYCILGLLPTYLERGNSSLVYMVDNLIKKSNHFLSGFYLHNHAELFEALLKLEKTKQPTLLFGVTYALLDFAEKYSLKLNFVKIIETGGMKGRREELTRKDVHGILKENFSLEQIYSEYGMTELFSQAYSMQNGIYNSPKWMKILIREINDPLSINKHGKGAVNIIDLANLCSCSFLATDDYGEVYENGEFEINGRIEQSEIRGCSLMAV